MKNVDLFSRRPGSVDFRPDPAEGSPSFQVRRLKAYMDMEIPPPGDITDCPDALNALREFIYRKTFTSTTHEQFVETDKNDPDAIDWLLAVAAIETAAYKGKTAPPRR